MQVQKIIELISNHEYFCINYEITLHIYVYFKAVPSIQLNDSVQEQYRIVPNDPINNIPEKTRAGVPLLIGTNKNDGSVILSRWAWSAIVWNETHNDFLRYKLLQDLLTSANFGTLFNYAIWK